MTKQTFTVALVFLKCLTVSSQTTTSAYSVNFSLGTVFPGKIQAALYSGFKPQDTYTFYNKQCLLVKGGVDYNLLSHLSLGVAINYVPISIKDVNKLGISDVTIHMGEIDGTIKGRYSLSEKMILKPGIAIGYRHTFSEEPNARENGVCLNAGVECHYLVNDKYFLSGEMGCFTQPYGGVTDIVYVRAFPILYLNFGFGINL